MAAPPARCEPSMHRPELSAGQLCGCELRNQWVGSLVTQTFGKCPTLCVDRPSSTRRGGVSKPVPVRLLTVEQSVDRPVGKGGSVDAVLGLALTSDRVVWALVDGSAPTGRRIDHDEVLLEAVIPGDIARHLDVLHGIETIAAASGYRIAGVGLTWSDDTASSAERLLNALRAMSFDKVVAVPDAPAGVGADRAVRTARRAAEPGAPGRPAAVAEPGEGRTDSRQRIAMLAAAAVVGALLALPLTAGAPQTTPQGVAEPAGGAAVVAAVPSPPPQPRIVKSVALTPAAGGDWSPPRSNGGASSRSGEDRAQAVQPDASAEAAPAAMVDPAPADATPITPAEVAPADAAPIAVPGPMPPAAPAETGEPVPPPPPRPPDPLQVVLSPLLSTLP